MHSSIVRVKNDIKILIDLLTDKHQVLEVPHKSTIPL